RTVDPGVVAPGRGHQQLGDHVEDVGESLVEPAVLLHRGRQLGDLGLELGDPRGLAGVLHGFSQLRTRRVVTGSSLPTGASPRRTTLSTTWPPCRSISAYRVSGSWSLRNSRKVRPP